MIAAAAVVPPAPVLLPEHASLTDPVPELRRAVDEAVRRLMAVAPDRVVVVTDAPDEADLRRGVGMSTGERVARSLLAAAGFDGRVDVAAGLPASGEPGSDALLVMANGSARRSEKAPGHLDERAFAFDDAAEAAFSAGDLTALANLDADLGDALLASGIRGLRACATLPSASGAVTTTYADDPYGVRWWVVTIACAS
ncbi:hypothetical protein CLV56_0741 [Mumia flava]|uniref:Uncharacterized protein n=1 Tax=Mumia flava TaxID=1348852 RepID=A0A0B2BJG8_9ACTN|nr:hypothetical protein [Mumia flava]PJJ56532.1 hypothetical protein CLV56_0741 [Mumia flava]